MNILGINAYHADSSAALLVDGELVAAVEEERFTRIKHWAGLPVHSVAYCLAAERMSLADIDVIAINQDPSANKFRKLAYLITKRTNLKLVIEKLRTRSQRQGADKLLQVALGDDGFKGKFRAVEHHQAHLASAFFVSPFEEAAVLSVDGFGDFTSTAWGVGSGSNIDIQQRVYFPHSLGAFYQALTQYLGFPNYGDEYKVMGLAPYGKPAFVEQLRNVVKLNKTGFELNLKFFRHHEENITFEWEDGSPVFDSMYSAELEELLGPARQPHDELTDAHRDLAHSIQAVYEETFFHILALLYKKSGVDQLAIAGGCGMNSVANGKVRNRSPFKKTYVQAAAGDAGGAIGAALSVWHEQRQSRSHIRHAYWGPSYNRDEVFAALDERSAELEQCQVSEVTDEAELVKQTAAAIARGDVIGWFQGRLEWGPRALGHRSIVCDPRRADMKDILNAKIKRRESFRPFAPSVLKEHVADWFEQDDDVPFMMKVFQIIEARRAEIPAVTHVDGSGRLQTVTRDSNGRYHGLIQAFYEETGVPMVLNTSFNENEPIVCKPEEALDCFLRTNMDRLVMEDFVIVRS